MNTGNLDTLIDLEAKTKAPNGMGGFTNAWTPVAPGLWASVWPVKGDEKNEASRTTGIATNRVRIRYRRGVRADWRIKVLRTGRYLSICSEPLDLGNRHEFLEMLCKEVVV